MSESSLIQLLTQKTIPDLNAKYNLAAVITILAYDILETFHDEMTYIWKKRFSITSVLYMITRYLPFLINVVLGAFIFRMPAETAQNAEFAIPEFTLTPLATSLLYCTPWFFVLACTEYLFITRAVALNGNSRLLYYALLVLFTGEMVIGSAFYLRSLPQLPSQILEQADFNGIIIFFNYFPISTTIIAFGIPELVFQSILILVIIITIIRHRKIWISQEQSTSLTTLLIRDGLWGYVFNLFGLLVIIIQPTSLNGPAGQPSLQWSYVTFSVTCSRLLLNIRSRGGTPAMTSISFNNSRPQIDMETGSNHGLRTTGHVAIINRL